MANIRKILFVPMDGADNAEALAAASRFAASHHEILNVLGTVDAPSRLQELIHDRAYFDEVQRVAIRERRQEIEHWAAAAGCPRVDIRIEVGNPALTALRRVNLECYDLVALPAGSPDADHAIVRRLLRKCPMPVWLIHTPDPQQVGTVVAAIDPNPAEEPLNRQILEVAANFAAPGTTVDVLTAWNLYGEETMRRSAFGESRFGDVDQMVIDEERGIRAAIEGLLEKTTLPKATWRVHLRRGDPAVVITDVTRELGADVIVVGTVARSGVSGLVMGNTAERVLDSVATSVVAVKPPGFVSPVQFAEARDVSMSWLTAPV